MVEELEHLENAGGAGGSGIVVVKELDKASGVWSLDAQLEALEDGTWPSRLANIDYMVVAGGGWWWTTSGGGGGGAGGYRASGYGPSPLQGSAQELGLGTYAVTVGGWWSGGSCPAPWSKIRNSGTDSIFGTITSAGGGAGATARGPSPMEQMEDQVVEDSNTGLTSAGLEDQVILLHRSPSRIMLEVMEVGQSSNL